jgi:hypothetical protein
MQTEGSCSSPARGAHHQALTWSMEESWNHTPAATCQLSQGEGKGPGAYNTWKGSSAYTGFSHPRRKTSELGQEARLKLPPRASLAAKYLPAWKGQ